MVTDPAPALPTFGPDDNGTDKEQDMKIVVIGGTGLIGSNVVKRLANQGHEAVPAAPNTGVNTLTGEGLAAALDGAQVVVDVANSPNFADDAVMSFFRTSTGNVLDAEAAAGVRHHVALSIVGAERLRDSGYMRAKVAQEELIRDGHTPYTIVKATQFYEFVKAIAETGADGDTVRLTPAKLRPMAADDVAALVAEVALAEPANGVVEVAGPEAIPLDELARRILKVDGDPRTVVADPDTAYFGAVLDDGSLTPDAGFRTAPTRFADWLAARAAG
ncbi:SDR family oxidoreductase [Actinoplanes sp. NPDC048796]|uniref:SDR family oxidoreductase n=1 Tax=Actinoplanes sp. NPDC048796 TaxID=3155640 RepID=UPI0033D6191A